MSTAREEEFGLWYAEKQGEGGDLWHRTLIDPTLFAALGRLPAGTRVLDVGCGNGYIARRLARAGARVVGVDASSELVEYARRREREEPLGVEYLLGDAAHLATCADASFDVAVANMSLMDIADAEGAIREVGRAVVDRGRFVFSLSHPCFDVDTRSAWVVESGTSGEPTVFRKVTGYRTPHSDRFLWRLGPDRTRYTVGYHRPLEWYSRALRAGGWAIVGLSEPSPAPEYGNQRVPKSWVEDIPMHLVVDARREPRDGAGTGAPSYDG